MFESVSEVSCMLTTRGILPPHNPKLLVSVYLSFPCMCILCSRFSDSKPSCTGFASEACVETDRNDCHVARLVIKWELKHTQRQTMRHRQTVRQTETQTG